MNMELTNVLSLRAADVQVGSNGPNARTAPVKIVAYTGGSMWFDGIGDVVFDLASMIVPKPRIPLDWSHDQCESIGYLNKFDIDNGTLTVSGALVPFGDDKAAELVFKMGEGVPYQASIESRSFRLEQVSDGESVTLTDKGGNVQGTFAGPCVVVRDWTLDAVAVCKWGRDSDTSTALAASKDKKIIGTMKVLVSTRIDKEGTMSFNKSKTTVLKAEDTGTNETTVPAATTTPVVPVVADPVVEPVAVDAKEIVSLATGIVTASTALVEACNAFTAKLKAVPTSTDSEVVHSILGLITSIGTVESAVDMVEDIASVIGGVSKTSDVVEGSVSAEASKAVEAGTPVEGAIKATVDTDPRAEFKRFVSSFGEHGARYFGEGLAFEAAQTQFVASMRAENEDLKKKLKSAKSDMGEDQPIKLTATADKESKVSFVDLIKKKR